MGLFYYTRLCCGVRSVPGLFQREIDTLLSGIEGLIKFFEDFLIMGPDLETHNKRLGEVLKKLSDADFRMKKTQCVFATDRIKFLCYEINKEGIHVSNDEIKAIEQVKRPESLQELQLFLSMLNYNSKFIKDYSDIVNPLYKLLRKNSKWDWTRKCESAFKAAKASLASYDVLMPYSTEYPVKITATASPTGIGAVLSHILRQNIVRPVAYASHTLTKAETGYSQLDKKAMALIFGVIVHYDTWALSSPLLHGVKLGPERSEGPNTPCNGLLKTLVSY